MDRLTTMAVFVRVAEAGSFAAAAKPFNISAAMVGKHIHELEHRLGARLISRTTRRHQITELGRAYYERCKAVLAEVAAADDIVRDQLTSPRGRLRVTMPTLFGRRCVVPVLLRLAERHADLELELTLSDQVTDLLAGEYDLAIRNGPLAPLDGVTVRRVSSQRMVVCASPKYLAEAGAPCDPSQLPAFRALAYRQGGRTTPWSFQSVDGITEWLPVSRHQFSDLEAICDAARSGLGLAWLPSWIVAPMVAAEELVALLPDHASPTYDCNALWPSGPYLPPRVRVAIDALAAELPSLMV